MFDRENVVLARKNYRYEVPTKVHSITIGILNKAVLASDLSP